MEHLEIFEGTNFDSFEISENFAGINFCKWPDNYKFEGIKFLERKAHKIAKVCTNM